MFEAHRDLVDEVVTLTGATPPAWVDAAAPTLQPQALDDALYLIGVIGGKDVGKSSLINALLGAPLARVTSFGEGTARALAYVHRDDETRARELLLREIPDQFDLITHDREGARGRVLLDLPDIDSVWSNHVELTRRLLRHMLFPIWVQSVEKYADQQPLQLLATVAAGNAAENFLFVLTKADQLALRHGEKAVNELKDDYATRVMRACKLEATPEVFATANPAPDRFELPALSKRVMANRSPQTIARARELARQQQTQTLSAWLADQRLDERLAASKRLLEEAESLVTTRLAEPIVDQLSSRLANDSSVRASVIEPVVRRRLSYWPIINVMDAILGPLVAAVGHGEDSPAGQTLAGRDVGQHVRGVFADLSQRDPQILKLYEHRKLWEREPADLAASVMQQRLDAAVGVHRSALTDRLAKPSAFVRFIAPIVTVGAALWFPIIQPIAEIMLQRNITDFSRETILLIVQLLGASYLIKSVGFLAIYYVALWMWLRWRARKRIDKALRQATDTDHPATSVLTWTEDLLQPIRRHVERLQSLNDRVRSLEAPAGGAKPLAA